MNTKQRIKQLESNPKLQPKEDNRITVFIDGMTTDQETG
jgi:DNA-binding transcriptional regulator YbjK